MYTSMFTFIFFQVQTLLKSTPSGVSGSNSEHAVTLQICLKMLIMCKMKTIKLQNHYLNT